MSYQRKSGARIQRQTQDSPLKLHNKEECGTAGFDPTKGMSPREKENVKEKRIGSLQVTPDRL